VRVGHRTSVSGIAPGETGTGGASVVRALPKAELAKPTREIDGTALLLTGWALVAITRLSTGFIITGLLTGVGIGPATAPKLDGVVACRGALRVATTGSRRLAKGRSGETWSG
jgi:hypothetical protein